MSVTHTVTHTTLKARSARRYKVNGAPAGFTALELPSEMPRGGASETAPSPSAPTPHKALASGASGSFCSLTEPAAAVDDALFHIAIPAVTYCY